MCVTWCFITSWLNPQYTRSTLVHIFDEKYLCFPCCENFLVKNMFWIFLQQRSCIWYLIVLENRKDRRLRKVHNSFIDIVSWAMLRHARLWLRCTSSCWLSLVLVCYIYIYILLIWNGWINSVLFSVWQQRTLILFSCQSLFPSFLSLTDLPGDMFPRPL